MSALNTEAKRKKRAFAHWVPQATPPPGTYDPALLAQEQAGQRGLTDFQADQARDTTRATDDFTRSSNDVTRNRDLSLADIARNVGRENENYGTATADVERNYGNLGRSQAGGIFAAGAGGGALAAAAAARRANQGRDQQGLDTTHSRAIADYGTQSTRTADDATRQLGALTLGNQRQGEDSQTALTRAVREQGALTQDTAASQWFQAAATGYAPPPKPANEGHRGDLYFQRDKKTGRATLESGREVSAAGLRAILARKGIK